MIIIKLGTVRICSALPFMCVKQPLHIFSHHSHFAHFPGEEPAGAAAKGEAVCDIYKISYFAIVQVRNFLPPQSDEPEIFILEQEDYTGNYGAKNGKKRELSPLS